VIGAFIARLKVSKDGYEVIKRYIWMDLQILAYKGFILFIMCFFLIPYCYAENEVDNFDAISLYNQGIDQANKGDYTGALDLLDNALAITPNFTLAHIARAGVLTEMGEYNQAIDAAKAAERLDPQNPSLLAVIANLYLLAGDYESSLKITDEAIKRDPELLEAWIIRGSAFGGIHEYKKEEEASLMALSLDPENEKAKENLNFARNFLYPTVQPVQTQPLPTQKADLKPFGIFMTIGIALFIITYKKA